MKRVSADIAEDIVQDVLFALWRRREALRIEDHLGPYLFAAVRSKVIQHVRHERVVETAGAGTPRRIHRHRQKLPNPPTNKQSSKSYRPRVRQALNQLSEQQQTVLTLRWTQGMTYDEIATVLRISAQ